MTVSSTDFADFTEGSNSVGLSRLTDVIIGPRGELALKRLTSNLCNLRNLWMIFMFRGEVLFSNNMRSRVHVLAEKIWHYHLMNHRLERADVILVLCSHDTRVAKRAAELFYEGWAPLLIFSGGLGSITKDIWSEPEADQFAKVAIGLGVPEDKILIENKSSNTGENVLFTRQLLAENGIEPQRFILVQKPYMERRSFATFKKLWPEKEVVVTSPQVSFDEYLEHYASKELSRDEVISIMVGDLQRIKLYPERGFQIYQEIPHEVWAAYEELVRAGYNQRLITT